ncbi:hypothetical protein AMECASPLE_027305, partial [Ameca splendens]
NVRSDDGGEEEEETTSFYESSVTPTPEYDYDYNVTFDYYFVTMNQSFTHSTVRPNVRRLSPVDTINSCRSITNQSLITSTLLVSLAALFH